MQNFSSKLNVIAKDTNAYLKKSQVQDMGGGDEYHYFKYEEYADFMRNKFESLSDTEAAAEMGKQWQALGKAQTDAPQYGGLYHLLYHHTNEHWRWNTIKKGGFLRRIHHQRRITEPIR